MSTNYVESSLKRFLKRKVKVTLGLVVAFMITGTVGFAEEIVQEHGENQWEWEQVKKAEEYIKTGDKLIPVTDTAGNPDKYFIFKENIYQAKIDDKEITFSIKDELSNKTTANLNNTFTLLDNMLNKEKTLGEIENLGEKYNNAIKMTATADSSFNAKNGEVAILDFGKKETAITQQADNGIIINKGILEKGQSGTNNSEVYNFGLISTSSQNVTNSQAYNYGLIYTGTQTGNGTSTVYNYGLILGGGQQYNARLQSAQMEAYNYGIIKNSTSGVGQEASANGAKVYNYGLITAVGASQSTKKGANNTELYNYGNIEYTSNYGINNNEGYGGGQNIFGGKGNAAYNYGIINSYKHPNNTNLVSSAQTIQASGNEAYNFGDINAEKIAQYVYTIETNNDDSVVYNYGTINTEEGKAQYIKGYTNADNTITTNNKAYNYGTINAGAGAGQSLEKSGEIYNFGTIKTDGTNYAMSVIDGADGKYNAENYGVIDISSADNAKVFKGDILNRGFVITKNGNVDTNDWNWDNTGDEWTLNRGVILNENFEVAAGTTADGEINQNVLDLTNKDNIVFDNGNIYVDDTPIFDGSDQDYKDRIHTVYMKNQTAEILGNSFDHKNILTVVDDNWNGGTIIEASLGNEDELSLFNTVITGYFTGTKGGTVMEVDSDLTLIGDTVISAIKGENVTEDVYALKLDKGINLTFVGKAQINGMIDGERGGITSAVSKEDTIYAGNIGRLRLRNANAEMLEAADIAEEDNFTDITLGKYGDLTLGTLELSFRGTADGETNNVTLNENVTVNGDINGALTVKGQGEGYDNNQINLTLNNISKISGDIYLGEYDDTITVNQKQLNEEYSKTIDGNDGNDTLAVNPFSNGENKLDYNIKNIETIELAGNWIFGDNLNVSMDGTDKDVTIKTAGTLTSYIDGNGNGSLINNGDAVLTVAGKDENNLGTVKYQMGDGFQVKNTISLSDVKFGEHSQINAPIIYSSEKTDTGAKLTLRDYSDYSFADEYKTDKYERMYDAFLGAVNDNIGDVKDKFNSFENDGQLQDLLKGTEEEAKAYYTAGYIVTKNIADTYLGVVEDFTKKARKGEWLAQAKFVNSDTEFDGGKVKGYEGDINGAVGMVEYGVSDTTSYGAVFGGGQTEVDINDGGKLDGDNYYVGGYIKHKTAGGIDILGNIGFVKSELDSELSRTLESSHPDYPEIQPGKSQDLVKGTADSTAITASLLAKKDFNITDTFKLQPKLGVRYNFIKQDKAENPGMGFVIDEQDVTIFEGVVGIGAEKSMAINNGHLALNTGVDYALSNASDYNETEYLLYGKSIELKDSEIADSKGTFYIGADYEHENGVGFNAKYEMMWSDEGDDSRITAGISYRF